MTEHEYEIEITQLDIDAGVRANPGHCVVSTAIGSQIVEATNISVAAEDIRFTLGTERLRFPTPPDVARYLVAFDAGEAGAFKPMKVRLSKPSIVKRPTATANRMIAKRESAAGGQRTRGREFGKRVLLVNQGTVDDDLAAYDRIRAKRKKGPPAAYKELAESLANIGLGKPSSVGKEA